MAIIQISRIQVRRGKEQQGTGVPRLASGELGWAVDTQRLYIGSGSIQEGAPSEGNVRLLTANDNILDLTDQYFYRAEFDIDGNLVQAAQGSVGRSLQSRLDDFVSARSFGVVGDGLTDDTVALQNAIDALFDVGVDRTTRSVLYIPAGTYKITEALKIPPFAQIFGAGIENTVIINNNMPVFETIGDVPINSFSQETQPRHIKIVDLSVVCNSNHSAIFLYSCRDSEFKNLKLLGSWSENSASNNNYAFQFDVLSNLVTCENNVFENIKIEKFARGIEAPRKIINNKFKNINFYELDKAVVFGDDTSAEQGPELNTIENCRFDLVYQEGIQVLSGEHNISSQNKFLNVGNNGGLPVTPVIDFRSNTNISVNDYFERTVLAASNNPTLSPDLLNQEYVPEVAGRTKFENLFPVELSIGQQFDFVPFIKLPFIEKGTIVVDYVYSIQGSSIVREGTLEITVNRSSLSVVLVDDYIATGGSNADLLEFKVTPVAYGSLTTPDTLLIEAKNSTFNLTNDTFYYTIKSKT